MEINYIDRKTGEKRREIVAGEKIINWVYDTRAGKTFLETFAKRRLFSTIFGGIYSMPFSRKKIKKFVKNMEIDMTEAEKERPEDYRSFNEFFIRKLKDGARPISGDPTHLVSPADGKILAYSEIDIQQLIQVKGQIYTLESLLKCSELAQEFQGGSCIVVRLAPADYHRFHFPDSGLPGPTKRIRGSYYSVNPAAMAKVSQVYSSNKRQTTTFQSANFGKMVLVEVGATCVGSIIQTYKPGEHMEKGQEKGYFKFGGSTVIMFIQPERVVIDEDILRNSQMSLETKIFMGEKIGTTVQHGHVGQ